MRRQSTTIATPIRSVVIALLVGTALCGANRATAQAASATPSAESLDTLVAPIALYPDALVADILPASTYPVQIVEAGRDIASGGKPTSADMSQWDASIQALVEFPSVLTMMSNQLTWTTQLGQAVSQSQANVMAAIQRVRAEAQKAGNLQSNDKQTVTTQGSTIIIQPANPQVIYVPQYNPVTIIEPAPAYIAAPAGYGMMTFGLGFAAGAMTAYACDWGHGYGGGSININNNYNYNNVNNNNYNHTNVNNTNVNNTNVNNTKVNNAKVNNASYSSWKAPTNVGHITNQPASNSLATKQPSTAAAHGGQAHAAGTTQRSASSYDGDRSAGNYDADRGYGSSSHNYDGGQHENSGGMFGGADGGGWSSRDASDRGAQSLGGNNFGHGAFGNFRSGGGSFANGGHPRF